MEDALNDIFTDIKDSFSSLWKTKQRGNSLEIITPYATTNNKFVSVFLSKQGNDYVVSDGGWLNSGEHGTFIENKKHISKMMESFDVKKTRGEIIDYYYVKCSNVIDVPSKTLDIILFTQMYLNMSDIFGIVKKI